MSAAPLARLLGARGVSSGPASPSVRLLPASRSFSSSSRVSASQASEQYDSLYSSAYSGQGAKSDRPKWYRSPTTLVLGFIPIFTLGLGTWQMQRLKWKLELIDELEEKLKLEPAGLPTKVDSTFLDSLTFRTVILVGTFDYSRAIFLGPRVREGTLGYHVVVPLQRHTGGPDVLVDRGFVAEKMIEGKGAERRLKKEAMETGRVKITTMAPRVYPPNMFTPTNDPATGQWFHADPAAMAAHMSGGAGAAPLDPQPGDVEDAHTPSAGIGRGVREFLGLGKNGEKRVLPALFEEVFDGDANQAARLMAIGKPVGRAASIELRNQHAVYAATWFSLSAATAFMFALLVRRGR